MFWSEFFPQKSLPNLRHAAACFKTPTNRPQKQVLRQAAACFNGMLQPLVLSGGRGARTGM